MITHWLCSAKIAATLVCISHATLFIQFGQTVGSFTVPRNTSPNL
jgi:hypothetical protein